MKEFENEYVTFDIQQAKRLLTVTWNGFVPSETFRAGVNHINVLANERKFERLIVNSQKQSVVKQDDNDYASSSLPHLFANGVTRMAFVLPENAITKLGIRKFNKVNQSQVIIGNFESLSEAESWIVES